MGRQPIRTQCSMNRYFPNPLGNVTAVQISVYCTDEQRTQRLPCVKGAGKIGSSEPILTEGLTTPPVKIEDFDHGGLSTKCNTFF